MKILIADDEVKVCNLIRNLVDWEALGLTVAGIVHNGKEALEFISKNAPDIVITDIRMPEVSGIDMIIEARRRKLDTHFIIISGYREFEYASQAIKNDVADYLLKPLKQKEIENALRKIIAERSEKQASLAEKEVLARQVRFDHERLKEHFLKELLEGRFSQNGDMRRVNEYHGCHFKPGLFALVMIRESMQRSSAASGNTLLESRIKSIIENEFLSKSLEMATAVAENSVVALINYEKGHQEVFLKTLRRINGRILGMSEDFSFFISVSQAAEDFSGLEACANQARKALAGRLFSRPGSILEYSAACEPAHRVEDIFTAKRRSELRGMLQMRDGEGLCALLEEMRAEMAGNSATTGWDVLCVYEEVARSFFHSARECGMELPETFLAEAASQCRSARTADDVFLRQREGILRIIEEWNERKKSEESRPIRTAKKYIREHYAEPLTLQAVSEHVGLSASYFSSAFKKEEGASFLDYLTQVRIDAAKELLMDTEMDMWDIAERVGFSDPKYFHKRFKKFLGISPNGYRKLYG